MSVYIPCLNPDSPDSGGGTSVGVGVGGSSGDFGGLQPTVSFTVSGSPFTFGIGPLPPFLNIGINFQFWIDLFGLGETRIHREKETIQDINTSIFRYLNSTYGVPITDGHALQFPSDGVQAQFAHRPDIAALVPSFMTDAPTVTDLVFASTDTSLGQQERVVNQFLANAAYNNWTVPATVAIWDGMVQATNPSCSQDPNRWMQNPMILKSAAQMGAILQYIPLDVLVDMATSHNIGDPLAEKLIFMWAAHPELVASIPHVTGQSWQDLYTSGSWCTGQYRYPLGGCVPLLSRDHIQPIINSLQIQLPTYPDFLWPGGQQSLPPPPTQAPTPPPTQAPGGPQQGPVDQMPQPTPPPPVQQPTPIPTVPQTPTPPPQPQGNVLEIPNQLDLDRACQIIKTLQAGQTLTLSDSQWLLTVVGARAYYLQQQNPLCYLVDTTGVTPQIPTPQPNCPPFPPTQQPSPIPGGQTPTPLPQPYPPPQPPQDLTPCPPSCQEQIDVLEQKVHECCNETSLYVVPQLQDLWHWIQDLESRVPGPAPQLPTQPADIPTPGGLPPPDVTLPVPDVPVVPSVIPPPTTVATCEQVLECVALNCETINAILDLCKNKGPDAACEEGILKWGKWGECWLSAFTVGVPPGPDSYPQQRTLAYAVGQAIEILQQEPGNIIGALVPSHIARAQAILSGDTSIMDQVVTTAIPLAGYIFEAKAI